jgi:hypothetical protein
MVDWVGGANLSVEFVVTDADSGQPIPNARINVHCDGGHYEEVVADLDAPFDLRTNGDGIATRLLHNSWCTGMTSRLRFTNTHYVHIPNWNLRAFAEGYETSEWINLWQDYPKKAERGVERNRLQVRIALHKGK